MTPFENLNTQLQALLNLGAYAPVVCMVLSALCLIYVKTRQ